MQEDQPILTPTLEEDLSIFFTFQLDPEANYLAAFTAKDPQDKAAYLEKYKKHLLDPSITTKTIRLKQEVVGSIARFVTDGDAEITYWIARNYWGRGVATKALAAFLKTEKARPVFGRVAYDNYGSQKVLEKNGFVRIAQDKGFANGRQAEIEEYIYKLS